jgi:hypothetical protein
VHFLSAARARVHEVVGGPLRLVKRPGKLCRAVLLPAAEEMPTVVNQTPRLLPSAVGCANP